LGKKDLDLTNLVPPGIILLASAKAHPLPPARTAPWAESASHRLRPGLFLETKDEMRTGDIWTWLRTNRPSLEAVLGAEPLLAELDAGRIESLLAQLQAITIVADPWEELIQAILERRLPPKPYLRLVFRAMLRLLGHQVHAIGPAEKAELFEEETGSPVFTMGGTMQGAVDEDAA